MLGKTHRQNAKICISQAQKGRKHKLQEGFQKGHESIKGTEKTRFRKGTISWNKGKGIGTNPIKIKLSTYRATAKKHGLPFEVNFEQMQKFVTGKCYYCGCQATGIDRVDNSFGYIEGNMVGCCGVCNHMKYTMSKKDFINKCKQIVTITGYEI